MLAEKSRLVSKFKITDLKVILDSGYDFFAMDYQGAYVTITRFLPVTLKECQSLNWSQLDIIIVSGDAYVDHPSFGVAIIARQLEAVGYKVGIIPQPDWRKDEDFLSLGTPKLFFGVTSGNMDSMVNHYTAQKKIRSNDAYSANGESGSRPDRAVIVYTQKLKQLFKNKPIIIGGIEASLRRIPHYDYWSDKIRNSVLFDSKADLLVYGMGEKPIVEVAERLSQGEEIGSLNDIRGTVVAVKEFSGNGTLLPEYSSKMDANGFYKFYQMFYKNYPQRVMYQKNGLRYLKHNLPVPPHTSEELDSVYSLPFTGKPHPIYRNKRIPAYEQIKESITSHRGCFGGCHFCALFLHQGKGIQSRSIESVTKEVKDLVKRDYFRGTVTDIGGPSANMYGMKCSDKQCKRVSCLKPDICSKLDLSHKEYRMLLSESRTIKGVKNLFIASGIRTDLALASRGFISDLVRYYTGGRLKLAPEHKSARVLKAMNKQDFSYQEKFLDVFKNECEKYGKHYSLTSYIMVGHPGTTLDDAIELAVYLKSNDIRLKQVQEFTPTPMTISTCMYYTGKDFETGEAISVPKGRDVRLQKALIHWFIPENKKYVIEALRKAKREDLIGFFFD
jgi:uncharacterized radical SAM protein YgiQ